MFHFGCKGNNVLFHTFLVFKQSCNFQVGLGPRLILYLDFLVTMYMVVFFAVQLLGMWLLASEIAVC